MGGRSLDDLRRTNLSRVLRLAHREGPLSRSELTRATGLNRSTVGGLVAELQARGLVDESDPGPARRVGRPSPIVSASDDTVALAINPEVDTVDIAVVGLSGRVLQRVRYDNERLPTVTEFVNLVRAVSGMLLEGYGNVLGAGLAIPGLVRHSDGHVLLAPHLEWTDTPLAALVEDALGIPCVAGNDANCGAVAESTFGGGRGEGVVVYLNGGASGIGGGVVIDGRLFSGVDGHAGEFGHTNVTESGRRCHCGAVGCLETEVRRDRFIEVDRTPPSEVGRLATRIDAAWGDPGSAVHAEITRQLGYLATAMRTVVNALNPRRIVLGGYLGDLLSVVGPAEIIDRMRPTLPGAVDVVSVVPAGLHDDVILVGAAEMVFAPVLDDPGSVPYRVDAHA
ncbi:ROK family protein [Microbacterium koreense]|uniref:ROK family protein n=1 Tax=Microbacterium koreense TaxID=323761 RepID=A0ABW2ZQU5_9MICO